VCGVSEQSPTEKKRTFGEKGDRCRINQKEQQRKFDSFDALLSYIYSSSKRREREKGWANDPHVSFPPDKRMNGRKKERKTNSKFSLLFEFLLSGKRAAASVCVCVSPNEHEINTTDMPRVVIPFFESLLRELQPEKRRK